MLIFQAIKVGDLNEEGEITMYVRLNGVHTDVYFPTETTYFDWTKFISKNDFPNTDSFDQITIGWGDKGFFLDTPTWAELKTTTALNAIFLPSETALHVAYSEKPKESQKCIAVKVKMEQYLEMIKYIESSFKRKKSAIILIHDKGYFINDNFYEAKGSYHLFKTCNSWTNGVLHSGRVYTSFYAFFPDGIMEGLK